MPPIQNEPSMPQDNSIDNMNMGGDNIGVEEEPPMNNNIDGMDNDDNSPKTELQKLAGELSQKLNDYISQNEDDSETSKYVLNMIAKQASKNLSSDDKKDVVKKLNSNDDEIEDELNSTEDSEMNDDLDIQEESINEILGDTISDSDKVKKVTKKNQRSPFYSNRK